MSINLENQTWSHCDTGQEDRVYGDMTGQRRKNTEIMALMDN